MSDEFDERAARLLPADSTPRSWSDYDVLRIKVAAALRTLAAEWDADSEWRKEAHRLFPTGPQSPRVIQHASDRLAEVEQERMALIHEVDHLRQVNKYECENHALGTKARCPGCDDEALTKAEAERDEWRKRAEKPR